MEHGTERAQAVRQVLLDLWGDDMPPTPDPVLAVLSDAVVVDDQHGIAGGLVVQGDGLTVDALARLVTEPDASARFAVLPALLRDRVGAVLPDLAGPPVV